MTRGVPVTIGRADLRGSTAASASACAAPFTSLHLDALGDVRACCQNSWYRLGHIPDQSLDDIWNGALADDLRRRLAAHDLSAGCDACRAGSPDAERGIPYARQFDHLAPLAHDRWPVQLELALSNRCNLACTMCSGVYSSTIRAQREHLPPLVSPYGDEFFEQLRPFLPHLERIELLGGEPFLSPEVHRLVDLLDELDLRPLLHVTTNGTIWTPWVEDLLARHHVDITVSVEGSTAETFEAVRVGASFEQVRANLERFADLARRRGRTVTIATCIMRETITELHGLLVLADQLDVDVYTNTVTAPASSSLITAPGAELRAVVVELDRQASRTELTRNRSVWEREVAELRHLAAATPPPDEERDPSEVLAAAADDLRSWSSGEVSHFVVDASLILVEVEPDPADTFGLDLRPVIGTPSAGWIDPLQARYGRLRSSSVVHPGDGSSHWTLDLGDADRSHRVRAVRVADPVGERWVVALRALS